MAISAIPYSQLYSSTWEALLDFDLVPPIFPPSLVVHMDGKAAPFDMADQDGRAVLGVVAAECKTDWMYRKRITDGAHICIEINPISAHVHIYHPSRAFGYQHDKGWPGHNMISYYTAVAMAQHDIVHEFGHYIHAYKTWLRSHSDSDDYPESYEESVQMLLDHIHAMGTEADERTNEAWTLHALSKLWCVSLDITPIPEGRYARWFSQAYDIPFYSEYCNVFRYYQAQYRINFVKLHKKELAIERRIQEETAEYARQQADPLELIRWKP